MFVTHMFNLAASTASRKLVEVVKVDVDVSDM